MTEEQVTKRILSMLTASGWYIIAYDFPQSGSGKLLLPDKGDMKNKGGIIPDIVTVKGSTCLYFENKDRVVFNDFQKVSELINNNRYSKAISTLLSTHNVGHRVENVFYGVGFPSVKWNKKASDNTSLVDFIIGVDENEVIFLYNPHDIKI